MKRLLSVLVFSFLFFITSSLVFAQDGPTTQIAPDYRGGGSSNSLTGENHNYSLVLKGNGNSVVLGRINFTNTDSQEMGSYLLEIPNLKVDNLVAFQEIPQPICLEYGTTSTPFSRGKDTCLNWGPPQYPDPYNSEYKKIDVTQDGDKYTFNFGEKVKEASSGGLIFSYNSTGYTRHQLGKYSFNFETPRVQKAVQNLNISIDTDNKSLYLDVKGETVNYNQGSPIKAESLATDTNSVRQIAPQIGSGGRVYKQVTSLTAGETVQLKGSYAASLWVLNLNKILIFISILLGLLCALYLLTRLNFWDWAGNFYRHLNPKNPKDIVVVDLTLSLLSSALVFGTILFLANLLDGGGVYQILPVPTGLGSALTLLISLLAFVFVLVVLALPSLLLGLKFGWKHTLFYILFEFMWLIVMIIGFAIIFSQFDQPQIYPLRGATMESKGVEVDPGTTLIN